MTYCSQSWDAIIAGDTSNQPSRYTQGHRSTGYVSLNKPLFRVMVRWARYFAVFCFACFKPTKTLNDSIENSIRESRQTCRTASAMLVYVKNHSRCVKVMSRSLRNRGRRVLVSDWRRDRNIRFTTFTTQPYSTGELIVLNNSREVSSLPLITGCVPLKFIEVKISHPLAASPSVLLPSA